jgi:hypothetical protein
MNIIKKIKAWFNRLVYRFRLWQADRRWMRTKREIGQALMPAVKDFLEEIERERRHL